MISRILCFFGRHVYRSTQEFGAYSRRVACTRCGRMFAMNDDCQSLVPWNAEFHRMYEGHGHRIDYKDWEGKCS